MTRSYYYSLMKAGVEFYEYQPGFLHAKWFYVTRELPLLERLISIIVAFIYILNVTSC